ncbi:MAG: ribonuclease R [Gammaproteobacteria bacterium]|nr:ribonuclease R [Gammaproteobacteria bacterium]
MTRKRKGQDDWRKQDPHHKRESDRYEQPLPSREYLLKLLREQGVPMRRREIFESLRIDDPDQRAALRNRLKAMVRDGQLLKNRAGQYCLIDKMPLVTGRVIGHRDGFGFVKRDDDDPDDLYLSPRQMREVMHGDRVAVRVSPGRGGRTEARIAEVLERANEELVGRYFSESGIGFVIPDNSAIGQQVIVPKGKTAKARPGQVVSVRIDEPPGRHSQPVGSVIEILGGDHTPGIETEIAVRSHNLPHRWPQAVSEAAKKIPQQVQAKAKHDRVDLRELPLVTIDGEDARDFDDAIFAEETGNGWRLYVAIADVAHYVKPGSELDKEAQRRGTSVYFPTRVIPMLPEELSNGLCSLNPEVDRLCMVCEMLVDSSGQVTRSQFYEGVMRSQARLTYTEVAAALYDGDKKALRKVGGLLEDLQVLDDLYRAFAAARQKRGAIEIETREVKFLFNEKGRIKGVMPYRRNDAHKIIEECMIAANVQAAKFLQRGRLPTLYRRHDQPEEERRDKLFDFLRPLGLKISRRGDLQPADYARLLHAVRDRPDAGLIETVLLRSMPRAVYAPDSRGHFGLALEQYAHFTSPIRRYPDLVVHRGIKHLLAKGKVREFVYNRKEVDRLGQHCSATERRADEATREATDWLKCEFMQDKVGDIFDGTVSGVTSFGLFVQLDDIHIEGLVHVTELGDDYFQHDAASHRLVGEASGSVYQLADRVRVRVREANMEDRRINFELADRKSGARKGRNKTSPGTKNKNTNKNKTKGKPKGKPRGRKSRR